MNDTPRTDAMLHADWHRLEEYSAPLSAYRRMTALCQTLERERDEALALLKIQFKKTMTERTTPETDEAQFGTGRVSVDFARRLERERDEARELADRLALTLGTFCGGTSSTSYVAWKEARND